MRCSFDRDGADLIFTLRTATVDFFNQTQANIEALRRNCLMEVQQLRKDMRARDALNRHQLEVLRQKFQQSQDDEQE